MGPCLERGMDLFREWPLAKAMLIAKVQTKVFRGGNDEHRIPWTRVPSRGHAAIVQQIGRLLASQREHHHGRRLLNA